LVPHASALNINLIVMGGSKRNEEGGLGEIRVSEGRVNLISNYVFNNTNLISIPLLIKSLGCYIKYAKESIMLTPILFRNININYIYYALIS
jgi:hypothetical protein